MAQLRFRLAEFPLGDCVLIYVETTAKLALRQGEMLTADNLDALCEAHLVLDFTMPVG